MIQVWICDFCTEQSESSECIRIHEETCTFNPAIRSCYTCGNADDSQAYPEAYVILCKVKADEGKDLHEKCPEVEHCPSWAPED